jgi:tRNA G18 (ribose-2'-O)-methylase SpoU
VAGLDAAGDTPIRDLDLATAVLALVIGSEGHGPSRLVSEACDVPSGSRLRPPPGR